MCSTIAATPRKGHTPTMTIMIKRRWRRRVNNEAATFNTWWEERTRCPHYAHYLRRKQEKMEAAEGGREKYEAEAEEGAGLSRKLKAEAAEESEWRRRWMRRRKILRSKTED